jgi:hypothetical protein
MLIDAQGIETCLPLPSSITMGFKIKHFLKDKSKKCFFIPFRTNFKLKSIFDRRRLLMHTKPLYSIPAFVVRVALDKRPRTKSLGTNLKQIEP